MSHIEISIWRGGGASLLSQYGGVICGGANGSWPGVMARENK